MRIVVTGTAGFIGYHLTRRLLELGHSVLGIDNVNDYYDTDLKWDRLAEIGIGGKNAETEQVVVSAEHANLSFVKLDIQNRGLLEDALKAFGPSHIVHLAAQAGVRYSLENPQSYIDSNITGFLNILELSKNLGIKHLVYASSSSVYGLNDKMPLSTADPADHPVSMYATTKRCNELMAHTYSHLYSLPTTGLRFFTVYGPWGRPDMAPMKFVKAILRGDTIDVYNNGDMFRDFTYIDDIVEGVIRVLDTYPERRDPLLPHTSSAPFRLFNIGKGSPVALMDFIRCLESCIGKKAQMEFLDMQPGDVYQTFCDTSDLEKITGYQAGTALPDGIAMFVKWYLKYNEINNE